LAAAWRSTTFAQALATREASLSPGCTHNGQ